MSYHTLISSQFGRGDAALWGSQSWLQPALSRLLRGPYKPPERRLQAKLPAPQYWLVLPFLLLVAASYATPQPGQDLFRRRCGGCHSPDRPMEGPKLRGVYGRRAGSTPDFQYSDALKNAKLTWNDELLDKWLTDTEALVPDNDMSFRVPNPDERRDIIAFLKRLSN